MENKIPINSFDQYFKYEKINDPRFYGVLFSPSYGGFRLSDKGEELLKSKFPNYDVLDITDQDMIRFMIENGLDKFGSHCSLMVEFIPIYESIRIPFEFSEYDGAESVYINIDYKEIARDLANNTSDNPLTKFILERGFDNVINAIMDM